MPVAVSAWSLAAWLAAVPVVIHQPHGHIFYGYYGRGRTAFYVALERLAARWTDRLITLTERGTEERESNVFGVNVGYNGVGPLEMEQLHPLPSPT